MPLEEVAIWEVPHSFIRADEPAREEEYAAKINRLAADPSAYLKGDLTPADVFAWAPKETRVFSYGLLLPEVELIFDADGRERLTSRWGRHEVEELHRYLQERDTTAALAADLGIDLRGTTAHDPTVMGLTKFGYELHLAADAAEHVPGGREEEENMRRFLDKVQRPDRFTWKWRPDSGQWARVRTPRYDDQLIWRLAIEYDHLVSRRPRLRRCKLCSRVFVPIRAGRAEVHCHADLWQETVPPRHLERCVPLDESERNRVKKKLSQRYRRALERAGRDPKHPDVLVAQRALANWLQENEPVRRGRQPRPNPGVIHEHPEPKGDQHG